MGYLVVSNRALWSTMNPPLKEYLFSWSEYWKGKLFLKFNVRKSDNFYR